MKYNKEELIQIAKDWYENNGTLLAKDFRPHNGLPHYQVYIKEFLTWNAIKRIIIADNAKYKDRKFHTRETVISDFIELSKELSATPNSTQFSVVVPLDIVYKYFDKFSDLVICVFGKSNRDGAGYSKEYVSSEILRFIDEFERIPISKDFNKLKGYPSRKTFSNIFGSFNNALKYVDVLPSKMTVVERNEKYNNESFLQGLIIEYMLKINKVPTLMELTTFYGKDYRGWYRKVFGGWNNALLSLNLKLNQVQKYEDSFLEAEFHRFVKENGRVPIYSEFNTSEYPSFWCYQKRFGSWNNAVLAYGYHINDENRKYILDTGEICASSYEHIVSTWLNEHKIIYTRNKKYKDFIQSYSGKMDCDYIITHNNKTWYVEVAGFLSSDDFNKISREEQIYYFKLKYKKKMLEDNNLNHIIIKPKDFKKKTMEDIFSQIFE